MNNVCIHAAECKLFSENVCTISEITEKNCGGPILMATTENCKICGKENFEYLWQGFYVPYFPDFIARAEEAGRIINYIIEVKGRMDDRDKAKKERAEKYVAMLTDADPDKEEWRYLFVLDNPQLNKKISVGGKTEASSNSAIYFRYKNG